MGCNYSTNHGTVAAINLTKPCDHSKQRNVAVENANTWQNLHDSILRNDTTVCQEILETRILDLNNVSKAFENEDVTATLKISPLHLACMFRKPKIMELLCRYGADVGARVRFGRTPINTCILYWPRVNATELYNGDCQEEQFIKRIKALHENSVCCLRVLLKYGANPSEFIDVEGHTLLHFCAKKGLNLAFEMLVEAGADIESADEYGLTPVLLGAKVGSSMMVEYLFRTKADKNAVDKIGNGILHFLCQNEQIHFSFLGKVLRQIPVDTANKCSQTSLMVAARAGNGEKIDFLLKNGADPSIVDQDGKSALFHLLDCNDLAFCMLGFRSLLINSLQINIYDNRKELPAKLLQTNLQKLQTVLEHESSNPASLYRICLFSVYKMCIDKCYSNQISKFILLNCPSKIVTALLTFKTTMFEYWKDKLAVI